MKTTRYLTIFLSLSYLLTSLSVHPLHETEAQTLAATGSLCAGVGIGLVVHHFTKESTNHDSLLAIASFLSGLSASALTYHYLIGHFSTLTPRHKMQTVAQMLQSIESDSLITEKFSSHQNFLDYIQNRFRYLGSGKDHADKISQNLAFLFDLAQEIAVEIKGYSEYSTLAKNLETIIVKVKEHSSTVNQRIKYISSCIGYDTQTSIYTGVKNDPLIARTFTTEEELVSYISTQFGVDWPLALAYNHLASLGNQLFFILTPTLQGRSFLKFTLEEIKEHPEFADLNQKFALLDQKKNDLFIIIEKIKKTLANNNEYKFQAPLYKIYVKEKRKWEDEKKVLEDKIYYESEALREKLSHVEEKLSQQQREQEWTNTLTTLRLNTLPSRRT